MPDVRKKSVIIADKEFTTNQLIRDLLFTGEKEFGQIKQHLTKLGIAYADNKGLALVLESMRKKRQIDKIHLSHKYPVYRLRPEKINDLEVKTQGFSLAVLFELENFPHLKRLDSESPETYFIRKMIFLYGFYMLYRQLRSWTFTFGDISDKKKTDYRNIWLKDTLSMPKDSNFFEQGINQLINATISESKIELYKSKKKQIKLKELENEVKQMYPNAIDFFDKIFNSSDKTNVYMKNVKELFKRGYTQIGI